MRTRVWRTLTLALVCGACSPRPDIGTPDAGIPDAGIPDAGTLDAGCIAKTCASMGYDCGPVADGCGGLVDCGVCDAGRCGSAMPNVCTLFAMCMRRTCADRDAGCGQVSDGCGGLTATCGTCSGSDTCGGAGVPFSCGTPAPCVPRTCAASDAGPCGQMSNGCSGLTVSCGTCASLQTCGGGGVPSTCGGGAPPCTKRTCADYPAGTCGQMGDGCGGLTSNCGVCSSPQTCGGGVPSTCGGAPLCTRKTCSDFAAGTCGQMSDGCGGLTVGCGTCSLPQTCGGGGTPSVCGSPPPCMAKTCANYPMGTCGQVSNGCGGLTSNCGTCTNPQMCGGGGVRSQCGGGGGTSCVNLQCQQVTCGGAVTTSISGTVRDPAGNHPLFNVFVYVPNGTVQAFIDGPQGETCAAPLSGFPLVQTTTDVLGQFRLTNMPVGANVPLVIQTGKWRRRLTVNTRACVDTPLPAGLTRLPANRSEGDLPKIAVSTGGADSVECWLRRVGISDSEFTNPVDGGRVNLFAGQPDGGTGAAPFRYDIGPAFPDSTALWSSVASLSAYDLVLLSCEGDLYANTKPTASLTAMFNYVNLGGRVLAGHYHHYWLSANPNGVGPGSWSTLAQWTYPSPGITTNAGSSSIPQRIVTSFAPGQSLASWLVNVAASTDAGTVVVRDAKQSVGSYDSSRALEWLFAQNVVDQNTSYPRLTQLFSFRAPIGAASGSQVGKLAFTDVHVAAGETGGSFPSRCQISSMSPQEKVLEFALFDLSGRVCDETLPPPPPTCQKRTCLEMGLACGPAPDGCGGTITNCGTCSFPLICATGGQCAGTACVAATCASLGLSCGLAADGCGGTLSCGSCTAPQTCGGTGVNGQCGNPSCVPATCATLGINCGQAADGCGGTLTCPSCPLPLTCGGGGISGRCGGTACQPTTCAALGLSCGQAPDGCGGTLNCSSCTFPQTCGGGGTPGVCGGTACVPATCASLGYDCGLAPDGCGGTLTCSNCTPPQTCGGGGVSGKCGVPCVKKTCAELAIGCGWSGDGCGGTMDCGVCPPFDGGLLGCTPLPCGTRCGPQGDGCGGALSCPPCP